MNKISRAIPPLTVGKRRSMIMTNRQCSADADTHRPQGFVQHRGTQRPPKLTRHLFNRMPNRWSGAVLSATASGLIGDPLSGNRTSNLGTVSLMPPVQANGITVNPVSIKAYFAQRSWLRFAMLRFSNLSQIR